MTRLRFQPSLRSQTGFILCVLLITALAAGLRLYNLDAPSLWTDELNTVRTCTQLEHAHASKVFGYVPVAITLRASGVSLSSVREDNIHDWQTLGINEFNLRLAPAVIGIATIPLVAITSVRLFGVRGALFISLLLAVAPWHIWMSQSARFYSQQFMFASLSLIWYFHATTHGSRRSMLLSMTSLVLAFLSQPPALVIIGVFALDWLIGRIRRTPVHLGAMGWTTAALAMLVCVGALAYDISERTEQWTQFINAQAQRPPTLLFGSIWMIGPVIALFAALSACILWRRRQRTAVYWSLVAVLPIMTFVAASLQHFIHFRYIFVSLIGWVVLAGLGAERFYRGLIRRHGVVAAYSVLLLLVTSSMIVNYGYYTDGHGFRNRWKDAFAYVQEQRRPGDLVIGTSKARYYLECHDIVSIHQFSTMYDLQEVNQPAWIVFRAASPSTTQDFDWIRNATELRMTYYTRVQQPYSSIHVYYYDPHSCGVHMTSDAPRRMDADVGFD